MKNIKKTIYIIIIIILVSIIIILGYKSNNKKNIKQSQPDYKSITYTIDGKNIQLKNNYQYFGNEAYGDFDNDGNQDIAFIFTDNSEGSGTFFYIVSALNKDDHYIGTNAIFLGDRISPQSTEFINNEIVVNYTIRKESEAMTNQPTIGVSKYLKINNGILTEINN
jgi:hypothetical protein